MRHLVYVIAVACALLMSQGCAASSGQALHRSLAQGPSPENAQRLLAYGKAFARRGDATRAEEYLNLALDHGADEREVTPLLISVCVKDRRYRSAVVYAEAYLRKHPGEGRLRFLLGTLYGGLGEAVHARKQLESLLASEPDHADAHFALALLLRDDLGDHGLADQHFRRYLALAPSGVHAEEAQGSLLTRLP